MNILVYDFEVFKYNWMVVIIDFITKEKTAIIDNSNKLENFYQIHKDDVWVGYNSRNYDQFILKGILTGLDPYFINNEIIMNDKNGYQVIKNAEQYPLINFDISNNFNSLKQLEGFMGSTIKETSIPFNIDRKLTEEEIQEVLKYCTHDVEQTIEVLNNKKEEYDSQQSLIEAFNLPMNMFNKTKAQLSAHILGAIRQESRGDEFNITLPDTLQISEKYQYVVEWYKNPENRDYKKSLITNISNVEHVFAWGGIHGAIPNYSGDGIILCCDVASLYPSIMIEYGFLSRNVRNPALYKEMRDTRLKLKAEKNPMQLPYKIVLNSTFGASKDKHNDLYDPLMANNVCVAGQLLLLDLIDKIEPYCELIQSNTDGLFMKVDNMDTVNKIKEISREWEHRTKLDLEWDVFNKIFQKDVNNYIIINEAGKYKSKGAYVKKLTNVDYDLPIVNNALINYFVHNKPLEDTINDCNDLREFQKIVKISSLYKYALYGESRVNEKVLRVFASKDESAYGVFKVKEKCGIDVPEKIGNTPEKCYIYNDSVINVKVPNYLDKQYYIDIAKKRLNDFLDTSKTNKKTTIPSDIAYTNCEVKEQIINAYKNKYNTFIDFLVELTENTPANTRQIEIFIRLNYFKDYGRNKKLYNIFEKFKHTYKKTYVEKTKLQKVNLLYEFEKSVEDIAFSIPEQMKFDIEYLGTPTTKYDLPKHIYILEIDTKNAPRLSVYGLNTGKLDTIKIEKKIFKKNKVEVGDIIYIKAFKFKPKAIFVGNDEKGKPIFKHGSEKECWLEEYTIKNFY
jgi:hypothetical protein